MYFKQESDMVVMWITMAAVQVMNQKGDKE